VVLLLLLAVVLADCSTSTRFTPVPLVQRLTTALDTMALAGVQLDGIQLEVDTSLPPTYYDTVSDHPTCVGAGDAISALRSSEVGGNSLTVLRDQRPGHVPITVAATSDPATLDGVDHYLAACSAHHITGGTLSPALVQVREEPGTKTDLRLLTETRTPLPSGTPLLTRSLLARSAGAGLLILVGPAPNLNPALVDAVRSAELTAWNAPP
jgi:hypothetical protein